MSLLDKINESISELDNNNKSDSSQRNRLENQPNNTYSNIVQENKQLKSQLNEANTINTRNIEEINELKDLIKNYNTQIANLKNSYDESIKNLKAQVDFEKEINERYLSKLVKSNDEINNNIQDYNNNSSQEKLEVPDVANLSTSEELDNLKDLINKNNDEVKNLINEIKEETTSSKMELIEEVSNQQDNLKSIISSNNENNIEELINDNFKQVNDIIAQNRENHNNTSSMIIEKINDIPSNQDNDTLDDIKSLISVNREELNNATNKIIDEFSNKSEQHIIDDVVDRINESIKSNNDKLISKMVSNSDLTKIDIFNKISDELHKGFYTNLYAYKKIRELDLFDEVYYKRTYDYNLDIDPLLHFIYKGYDENKKPSEDFDPIVYKQSHENIKYSTLNPLVYFVTKGIKEGNVKINEDFEEINNINKFDVDEEIENFTIRGVKKSKRKPRLIVSLSSIPEHLYDLQYTLYSLLSQQLKADKVILWLSIEDFPNQELDLPKEILKFKQNGLSIRFCQNLKDYNTIIPVINTYPKDIIITANDNIFYPNNWLKILYYDHKNNPDTIIAHKTKIVSLDQDNNIEKSDDWRYNDDETIGSYKNFAINEAGVLYPPNMLFEDILNKEKFTEYDDNVDAWLWAMVLLNHKKVKLAENNLDDELTYVNPIRETNLLNDTSLSYKNCHKDIDTTINNIVNKYPEIKNIINEE